MPEKKDDQRLPKESVSQRIGREAVMAFESARPSSWAPTGLEGDEDFGLDKQIQVVDPNGLVVGVFRAQIKGSRQNKLSADGERFPVVLNIKTLNYYARIQEPIMLVYADLSAEQEARECPVYWTWITEDIRDLLGDRKDFSDFDEKSRTFHVPSSNELTRDFDLTADLEHFRSKSTALSQLYFNVAGATDAGRDTPETISSISRTIADRGSSLVSALASPHDSPWIEPKDGSVAAALKLAYEYVVRNDEDAAEQILDGETERIEKEGVELERAEAHFLHGKICALRRQSVEALEHYKTAADENPDSPRYQACLLEAALAIHFPNEIESLNELRDSLPLVDHELVTCARARISAALGSFDEALELLDGLDSTRSIVARALIHYLAKNWELVREQCDAGLAQPNLKRPDRILFHILKARTYYYESLADWSIEEEAILPPFGHPGMDFERAWLAWDEVRTTLGLLRMDNWPVNTEHIVDVAGALSVVLQQHKSILSEIDELSICRPSFEFAHTALLRLAALAGDTQLALRALDRLPDSDDKLHQKILALHDDGEHQAVLSAADEALMVANEQNPLHGACLVAAAVAAHALLKPDQATPYEDRLQSGEEFAAEYAVYRFVRSINDDKLGREEAVAQLDAAYAQNPDFIAIQDNLFPAISALNEEGAAKCLQLGDKIAQRRRLSVNEVHHLAQAQITLQDWESLHSLVDDSLRQYSGLPSLRTLKAIAFEGAGDAASALRILEEILDDSPSEDIAIESYANICIRNGFHALAIEQLELLLQRAESNEEKAQRLQQLYSLQMVVSPGSERLLDIAWRYGRFCDRTDERKEGLFLQMFLMGSVGQDIEVSEEQRTEFEERCNKYFEQFPNSEVITRFQLPEKLDAQSLLRALDQVLGVTPEGEKWFTRMENELNRGKTVAPYVWLPRRVLRTVPDVAYLWAFAKMSSRDAHAYHLSISPDPEEVRADLSRGLDRVPILDITTLIVLHEIGMLETTFELLPRVAIGKKTLVDIQNLSHPYIGGHISMSEISEILKDRIAQIDQPGLPWNKDDEEAISPALSEIKGLASTGHYTLYVDDERARQFINLDQEELPSITTIDLLFEAERRGVLQTSDVSEKLARLIECRAIVTVQGRYFLASIPKEVDQLDDVDALVNILNGDETYSAMVAGLWDIRNPYDRLLDHVAAHLATIALSDSANVALIAAVWRTWLDNVHFRQDPDFLDNEHAAFSMATAAVHLKNNTAGVKRLWDAFVLLLQTIHREQMDKAIEMQSRATVGQIAAKVAHDREPEVRDAISGIMSSGLTKGTEEYDAFVDAYTAERIKLESAD